VSDYLIDTNILVRLVLPQDPLNPVAAGEVDELKRRGDKTCVAAQNLIEFDLTWPSVVSSVSVVLEYPYQRIGFIDLVDEDQSRPRRSGARRNHLAVLVS
jgi:hypothetical protein